MSIGVGIVGYGEMAKWHASRLASMDDLRIVAVADVTPARRELAAAAHDCRTYEDVESLVDDENLDVVLVATPSHAHVEPVMAALRAGKHVLVEKPIALTEADARRMFAAAREAGRTLMTFQNRRGDPDFLTAKRVIDSGELGLVRDIRLIRWHFTALMRTFGAREFRPGWRTEAAFGGGNLLDWGPHLFDQVLQIVPAPLERVFGDLRSRRWATEVDDQFLAVLQFAGGVVAVVEYAQAHHPHVDVSWAISGERGGFRYENNQGNLYSRNAADEQIVRTIRCVPENWDLLWENMRAVVRREAEPLVTPHETLRLMRLLDAVRESARTGQVVAIEDEFAPGAIAPGRPRAVI